jgi:hypothetical protein
MSRKKRGRDTGLDQDLNRKIGIATEGIDQDPSLKKRRDTERGRSAMIQDANNPKSRTINIEAKSIVQKAVGMRVRAVENDELLFIMTIIVY